MTRHKTTRIIVGDAYQLDGRKRLWVCERILSGTEQLAEFASKGGRILRLNVIDAERRMKCAP